MSATATADAAYGRELTGSETSLRDGEQLWPVRPAQASSKAEREAEERARSESRMERERTCEGAAQDVRSQATVVSMDKALVISLLLAEAVEPIKSLLG